MTEDEAKTKICHRTLAAVPDASGGTFFDPASCIGSACMAWRGKESAAFTRRAEAAFRERGGRLVATPADIEGFCGLAGAPQ